MKSIHIIFTFFFINLINANAQIWESVTPSPEFFPAQPEIPDTIHLRGTYGNFVSFSDDAGASFDTINLKRYLYSCSFISANNGWVSADSGRIFRTNDGCQTWDTIIIQTNINIIVDFVNNMDGFAYRLNSHSDSIYVTNDGGTNWILKPSGVSSMDQITFLDTQYGWSIVNGDSILKVTQNGGASWTVVSLSHRVFAPVLFFLDHLNGWIASPGNDSLMRTRDGGFTWQNISSQRCNANLCFKDTMNGVCVFAGYIFVTSDGGLSWTGQLLNYDYEYSWCTASQGRFYATGNGAVCSDDGSNWTAIAYNSFTGGPSSFYIFNPPRLEFLNAATGVFLSGDEGTGVGFFTNYVYLTEDSGKNWRYISDIFPLCYDLQMVNDSLWYFNEYDMHSGGALFCKSYDHLQTRVIVNDSIVPFTFHFTDSLHGVCGGRYTSDGGVSWIGIDTNNLGGDYSFIDSQNGWSIGGSFVSRTYDGGLSWSRISSWPFSNVGNGNMVRIQFPDSLHGFICQTPYSGPPGFFKSTDGGFNWQDITPPFNFKSAFFTDSIHGWLAGENGIFYTSDGGFAFQQQSDKNVALVTFIDSIHGYCEGAGIFLRSNQLSIINNVNNILSRDSDVKLFPNPNDGYFTLHLIEPNSTYKIFDNLGRELLSGKILNEETKINFSSYPDGIYFALVISKNQISTKRFIKN